MSQVVRLLQLDDELQIPVLAVLTALAPLTPADRDRVAIVVGEMLGKPLLESARPEAHQICLICDEYCVLCGRADCDAAHDAAYAEENARLESERARERFNAQGTAIARALSRLAIRGGTDNGA